MKERQLKRGVIMLLTTVIFMMSIIPYLPVDILTAFAFRMQFNTSTSGDGHYDISGRVDGQGVETDFLCMKKGASAKSGYDYYKTDNDVDYSNGTLEDKRLFWAYMLTYGNYTGIYSEYNDHFMENTFKRPYKGNTKIAKEVAWSHGASNGGSALIEKYATDGFMSLENIPAGCKSPEDIFSVTSQHGTPETAISINSLKSGPGVVDLNKLYDLAGIKDMASFQQYCNITASDIVVSQPGGEKRYSVKVIFDDLHFRYKIIDPDTGYEVTGMDPGPILFKVTYDKNVFKVLKVTGKLEYFETNDAADSQPFYRAFGKVQVSYPEFYMTTGEGFTPPTNPDGGDGGLDTGDNISVKIYEHQETFESNYKVDLTKYDYETGYPLKDSIWQTLEAFPDKDQIGESDETDGKLVESKMREEPTTWNNWLIFEEDMATDENGYISHADKRYYDFAHKYCDGHPIPPEPETDGDDEEDEEAQEEYEALMEQWQEAVNECEAAAQASNGTFHHWMCGSESEPSEEEAFEQSGCKAARDAAYENFINLRYSYTFRETDARDGYIIHGQNGHPDDVPIEIVTIASSEAGKEAEWTQCDNEDIIVEGRAQDHLGGGTDEGDTDKEGQAAQQLFDSKRMRKATDSNADGKKLYLTETYDLSMGERIINALRNFVGLPEKFISENELEIKIVAEYDVIHEEASHSDAKKEEIDDIVKPLPEENETSTAEKETDPTGSETESTEKDTDEVEEETEPTEKDTEAAEKETEKEETEAETEKDTEAADKETESAEKDTETAEDKESGNHEGLPESGQTLSIIPKKVPLVSQKNEDSLWEEDEEYEDDELRTSYSYDRDGVTYILEEGDPGEYYSADGSYIDLEGAIVDSQPPVTPGDPGRMGHSFKVYDHRVPGQIHFNKKDMDLAAGENGEYDAYGDTQGDSTLEGAVYGLFAADNIYGPDTQRDKNGDVTKGTGIIFDANDLVAVATTDKNGDGSFLTITEKPHSIYNYKEGQIEYTGKEYPKNLYDADTFRKEYAQEETGRVYKDNVTVNGDYWIGRPLILGNYYIKELTRSEGFELSITGKDMEITNASEDNRNDYGETEAAKSHPEGSAWITQKFQHVVTFPESNPTYGNRENLFNVEISSNEAVNGFNVVFDGLPEGADFYFDDVKTSDVTVQVPVGGEWADATEAPLYLTAEDSTVVKRDKDGLPIKNPNAKQIPLAYSGLGYRAKEIQGNTAAPSDVAKYNASYSDSDSNNNYVKYELEQMMREMGINTPSVKGIYSEVDHPIYDEPTENTYGMPEVTIDISNVTTNASIINAILDYYSANKVYTYGSLQAIEHTGNSAKVTVAVGMNPKKTALYQTNANGDVIAGYLFKENKDTRRYVLRKYTGQDVQVAEIPGAADKAYIYLTPDYKIGSNGLPEDIMTTAPGEEYLCYNTGDTLYDYWYEDNAGNWVGHEPVRRKVYVTKYEEQTLEQSTVNSSKVPMVDSMESVKDPVGSTYVVYDSVSRQYTLHAGTKDANLVGVKKSGFTVAIPDGSTTLTQNDINKIGENNVWGYKVGDKLNDSAYIMRVSGAGAGVFTSADFNKDRSYIKNQRLIYNGNHDLAEDGNTNESPNSVVERIIRQKIKVTKTIDENSYNNTNSYAETHKDWFTEQFGGALGLSGGARKIDNFRFKTYLKSNLTRLFRDNDGNVVWQNRKGEEIPDQAKENEAFPAQVNKIFTKVPHMTDPLFKESQDAAISNEALYSYTDGMINEDQNQGYTSILETTETLVEDGDSTRTVKAYNYDKFFDAIAVANNDKWDDASAAYTSWRPIGNKGNRTDNTLENAKVSDRVRQFAIDWYLDDEIKKLVKDVQNNPQEKEDQDGTVPYSDETYDEALARAIKKAKNYLKPFFAYDMDEIYAVEWDGEEDGGKDKDPTTLSADMLWGEKDNTSDGYYFGNSCYLPYGTYVVVEQQPKYDQLEDFKNRHYQIDRPKEVTLPAVYDSYEGSQSSPETMNGYYNYNPAITQAEMEKRYKIRFNEEMSQAIKGRNADGDFEVYKYGMDIDQIRNGEVEPGTGDYFALTQDEFKPYKNYYNSQDDRTTGDVPYYLSEGSSGRVPVSKYYRYSSVSEQAGAADGVPFPGGKETEDNIPGIEYRDGVKTMQGVQKAYDGLYAAMLVPWTVTASENAGEEAEDSKLQANGESSYKGFDYIKFRNRFFTAKLRIEKIDSETHENILHDGAIFQIYAAKRNDSPDGNGQVMFYEEDTTVTGSREFLEAMRAERIVPVKRSQEDGAGTLYSGVVPAGTPICEESEQIIQGDAFGNRTVEFKSYSTVRDGLVKDEDTNTNLVYRDQTAGYVETPQPLGAGVYVLAEVKAPAGYVRTKPVAIEVYSDKISYYKEGNKDKRVIAAMYEYPSDHQTANGTKPQDTVNVARIYAENAPIKLEVQKQKPTGKVTFRIGKRIEGSLTEIGGNPELEYAYSNGTYLGYAYPKGTLERLMALKKAGEDVEIVYDGNNFAGYGYVTRERETADDENPFVAGAKLTMFDAIELKPSGDTQDHAFEGLTINRSDNGNVQEMFVKKGYAGTKVDMVKEKDENGKEILTDYVVGVDKDGKPITQKGYIWGADTVERPDTDILYYDLDSLSLTWTEKIDGRDLLYGWDKKHKKVSIQQLESDKQNQDKSDREPSIYAFSGGQAVFEFTGGDFTKLSYDPVNKMFEGDFAQLKWVSRIRDWKMSEGTIVYHLDREGNRDAMVDPYTGMAYVLEPKTDEDGNHVADRVLVWPVNIAKDDAGNVISRDKITTSRIATVGENEDGYHENEVIEPENPSGNPVEEADKPSFEHTESGYITGTWKSDGGEESHKEETVKKNKQGQNMNEEVLNSINNGTFLKYMNPVYDEHGLVLYYQRSDETYDKGTELYDRNGDFVRYKNSDQLEKYNNAAYVLDEHDVLYDGRSDQETQAQDKLYHRMGESYILENTWVTSDKYPNDPFREEETEGQADLLKRVPAGSYIVEELSVPSGKGYVKSLPTGITIGEDTALQTVKITDDTTKDYIEKVDSGTIGKVAIRDMSKQDRSGKPAVAGESEETVGNYTNSQIAGAEIALYPAKFIADITQPDGYRLEKASDEPLVFESTNSRAGSVEKIRAEWTTGDLPIYIEGIPEGYYILEELSAPVGFIKADPVNVQVTSEGEIQNILMKDDHTKLAFKKYTQDKDGQKLLPGAEFALYEAKKDTDGNVVYENGIPQYEESKKVTGWISDDATDYTETIQLRDYPNTSGKNEVTGFTHDFEAMYQKHGIYGTGFTWSVERTATRDSTASNVWVLEDGNRVVVRKENGNEMVTFPPSMSKEDRDGFKAAYADMIGEKRTLKWAVTRTATIQVIDRIDSEVSGGGAAKYPTAATLEATIQETGKKVRIKALYNGQEYEYSYKFNYEALPGISSYANTWLTADGLQRADYLPVNAQYVLVEEKAPLGYAKADPVLISVDEITDIQLHDVCNERSAMVISKISSETGKELAGAKLALYRADEQGGLTLEDNYLIETWVTGNDGVYTELDLVNGLIPDGFREGDLKPHYIYDLPDGIYYLTEQAALPYYTAIEPMRLEFTGGERIQIVRATDKPVVGKLVVNKTDETGNSLSGVIFELTAKSENGKTVDGFPRRLSDVNGTVTAENLPVGETVADGTIRPYTYTLKEIVPPNGFAANKEPYIFRFDDGTDTYTKDHTVTITVHEATVKNSPTQIYLSKKDLTHLNDEGTDGIYVDGAELAVYKVSSLNENGEYTYREEDLFERWISSKAEGAHCLKGLIAGQSYVMVELTAPDGYTLMKPILFTVTADGNGINHVSNQMSVVKAEYVEDIVAAVTIKGRSISRTETAILNQQGQEVLRFENTGEDQVFHENDGLSDGETYTFAEHTIYSDGTDTVTKKVTRRVYFNEAGEFLYKTRRADRTELSLTDRNGTVISQFEPTADQQEQTIKNTVNPENPRVTVKNRNGEEGEPILSGQPVICTIRWFNPLHTTEPITVTATLDENLEILDAYDGTAEGKTITWLIGTAEPFASGSVSFAASIAKDTAEATEIAVTVQTGSKTYETGKYIPIQKDNCLTVWNELTGSGKEQHRNEESVFTIRLWDKKGNELAGKYAYTGSSTGMLRSGDSITLRGNEFITIDPATFKSCSYEVVRKEDGKEVSSHHTKGVISEDGAAAWFSRSVVDENDRDLFVKGTPYFLTETTIYTDRERQTSNKFSFNIADDAVSINGVGGYDKETEVSVAKADILTGQYISGAYLLLTDDSGNIIKEWVSGEEAFSLSGLTPGKTYHIHEKMPPSGYGYALDLTFTMNGDGAVEEILMEDRQTEVVISKKDITNGEELPGAHLQIIDKGGNVIEEWISTDTPHKIVGKLLADESYTLRETIPADGFVIANDIQFTVNHDGSVNYVEMKDDTTKVKIFKNVFEVPNDSATSSEARRKTPLAGAVLQILNEDKTPVFYEGREMIFTTGESFTLFEKQLVAGKTYWLHEVKPAPGYGYADDVKFTVSEDGSVDIVEMEDKPTIAAITKTDITGSKEIPGCEMQLVDKNGTVIDQWISGEGPHIITAKLLADETYRLIETNPAPGYAYAKDVTFTVNHDGTVNKVEMKDDITKVEILKVNAETGRPLAGAVFEIWDHAGNVIDKWVSTETAHKVYGTLNAGETYILHEVSAPSGYKKMEDVEFKVNDYADVLTIIADNRKNGGGGNSSDYTIRIKKVDTDGNAVPGAAFKVTDGSGNVLSGVREENGTVFKFHVKTPQTLTVSEITPPQGYTPLENSYRIELSKEGDAILLNGDSSFYQDQADSYVFYAVNEKTPPQIPVQPSKKGTITAEFDEKLYGLGRARIGAEGSGLNLTKTGDNFPAKEVLALLSISLLGMGVLLVKKRKGKGSNKKPPKGGAGGASRTLTILLMALCISLAGNIQVSAEENTMETARYQERTYLSDTDDPQKQKPEFEEMLYGEDGNAYVLSGIKYETLSKKKNPDPSENLKVTTSAPFTDTEENHIPEQEIREEQTVWYLKSYEVKETQLDAREEPVSDTVVYRDIPVNSQIPEMAALEVTDSVTGDTHQIQVPLAEKHYGTEKWIGGFMFPITVSNYDANVFELNGKEIQLSETEPLKGYEKDLLDLIGVSDSDYRITQIAWNGEAYEENGVLCRKLTASGEMRVTDCHAVYTGVANLPAVSAKEIQAVYTDRQPATSSEAQEGTYTYTIKATATYTLDSETLTKKSFLDHLIEFISNPVVLAVLLLLLFAVLVLWIVRRRKDDKKFQYISLKKDNNEEKEEGGS